MKKIMLGNAAVARGAYEAGLKVVSSYPGTPSTEITECLAKYDEVYCEWAPNEKVATETAIGASVAGGRAMTCMKHVGVNVAADPLFTVSYTGVNGGLVICTADDQGMHSSQNEQDSRNYAKASKIPMLEPSDSAECKEFTKNAFEISEKYDTPVFIRLSTRVSHSQSIVEIEPREEKENKEYVKDISKYVMMPANAKKRHVVVEERMLKLKELSETLAHKEINSSKIGVITAGIAYQYAKEALGNEVSYLKLDMVSPLPEKAIKEFAKDVEKIYVIEELDPFIEEHCKAIGVNVIGKEVFSLLGEYTPEMIKEQILGKKADEFVVMEEKAPIRPPVMCPGCPHRGMFYVLKKLGLRVCGDIGCYTLGAQMPLASIDTVVCMGASIGMAHGMEKASGEQISRKTVSVIGDSTFIHSGITALTNMVYNHGQGTVIILDNSITGMTGHQQNPTTGYTIKNEPASKVNLVTLAQAVGVQKEHIRIADPFDLDKFEQVVREEINAEVPSVIISQRPCALLKYVKFEGQYKINSEKCKKCKMCLKLGCPAITVKNGEIKIDASLCNGCGLCKNVCKFSAIEKVGE